MTTTFTAKFDGKVLTPQKGVKLPIGEKLKLRVEKPAKPQGDSHKRRNSSPAKKTAPLARLVERLEQLPPTGPLPELPCDLAAQVDHYLYGTPKRP